MSQFDKDFLERQNHVPVVDRSGVSCIVDYPDITVIGYDVHHEGILSSEFSISLS